MVADLQEKLRKINTLCPRVISAYKTMLKAKQDIKGSGYELSSEGSEVFEKVEELATNVAKIIKSLQKNPNFSELKQICDAINFDKFEETVGNAEDWAKIFQKQADQAVSNPNGLGNS